MLQHLQRAHLVLNFAQGWVLTLVLDNLDHEGAFRKGHHYIEQRTGEGHRAVMRAFAELVARGLLTCERRGSRQTNVYRPVLPLAATPELRVRRAVGGVG